MVCCFKCAIMLFIDKLLINFAIVFFGMWMGALSTTIYSRLPDDNAEIGPTHKPTCDNCGSIIPFKYFFPILGFLISKGRCAKCHVKIPVIYLLLEAVITMYIFCLSFFYKEINDAFIIKSMFSAYVITLLFIITKYNTIKAIYIWPTIILSTLSLGYNNTLPSIINLFLYCILAYLCCIFLKKRTIISLSKNEHILLVILFMLNGFSCLIITVFFILFSMSFSCFSKCKENTLLSSLFTVSYKKFLFITNLVCLLIQNLFR